MQVPYFSFRDWGLFCGSWGCGRCGRRGLSSDMEMASLSVSVSVPGRILAVVVLGVCVSHGKGTEDNENEESDKGSLKQK